jgi:hypothetical protein
MLSSGTWRRVDLVRPDVSEGEKLVFLRSVLQLLVTANVVPSSLIVTLMMEEIRSSEKSVLVRPIRRHIPESGILHVR